MQRAVERPSDGVRAQPARVTSPDMAASSRADVYTPVMGTVLEIVVQPPDLADAVAEVVLAEIARLSAVLSGHDPLSELSRWRRGELEGVSGDLVAVLHAAEHLHRVSGGAFNPAVGVLHLRWTEAEQQHLLPDPTEMRELANDVRYLPYRTGPVPDQAGAGRLRVERLGGCAAVDLDALAKGYVVDAAVMAALDAFSARTDLGLTVNAGGDLRHAGAGSRSVRIENPMRPFDNAPALTRLRVQGEALATSGTARRYYEVGGRRLGQVLDPRTGWPVRHCASVSILAADTMTADGVATAAMVLPGDQAVALVEDLGLACLLVAPSGATQTSTRWPATGSHAAGRQDSSDADPDQHDAGGGADQPEDERGAATASDGGLQHDSGQ